MVSRIAHHADIRDRTTSGKITQLLLIWDSYNYREVCRQKFYTMMVLFKKNFRVSI